MIEFFIPSPKLKTYASPDKPFLAFNEFVNIAQDYRDRRYAPENVPGFIHDIGKQYNVWTRRSNSTYHRHIFPDQLEEDVYISFEIPHLKKNAWFPIFIKIYDDHGVYFEHLQEVVIERVVDGRLVLSGWRKVPTIANFLLSEQDDQQDITFP